MKKALLTLLLFSVICLNANAGIIRNIRDIVSSCATVEALYIGVKAAAKYGLITLPHITWGNVPETSGQ